MATSLSGAITIQAALNYTNGVDLRTITDPLSYAISATIANGSGAGQAAKVWADTRTTDATGETLDFNGGGLTDAFGAAVALTRCVAVIVTAATANATAGAGSTSLDVLMTRPATAGMDLFIADADGTPIKPGMTVAWLCTTATAVAMVAGDTDSLKFAASNTGNVTYTIIIVGS